jgi:Protein of unknown function (DUF3108)
MAYPSRCAWQQALWIAAILCALLLGLALVPAVFTAENQPIASLAPHIDAFFPGESLTYDISWSRMISAGTATMEVKEEKLPDGRDGLKFVVTGRSVGLLDKVYPVNDSVESIFDPQTRESISYRLRESYGGKKRRRDLAFDHTRNIVVNRLNDDPAETLAVPEHVQDGLSMLYNLRTREDFVVGKIFTIEVHDSGKNWSVEVHTLGRERLKTPMGEFATVKVKTYPKYKGAFMNKGEVFIWLTDDNRRVPVLMKSKLAFGTFVFTLMEMTPEHFLEAPRQ